MHISRVQRWLLRKRRRRGCLDLQSWRGCCILRRWTRFVLVMLLAVVMATRVRLVVVVMLLEEMVVKVGMLLLLNPHVPQVPVLADELVHSPVELLYPSALGLDEALLVLDDGSQLPQVQNRLHWVFQETGGHHSRLKRKTEKGQGVN